MKDGSLGPYLRATSAAIIAFASLGIMRSFGVLFVEVVNVYGVSREQAAWPFSLQTCTMTFSGILPGLLEHFLSRRHMMYLSSSLIVFGFGLCYCTFNFGWFVFCIGILFGLGYSLLLPTTVVILNRGLENKHRATANGVMWAGDSMALFFMPPIYNYLTGVYGLHGTLLIVSGAFLNLYLISYYLTRPQSKTSKTQTKSAPVKTDSNLYLPKGIETDKETKNAVLKLEVRYSHLPRITTQLKTNSPRKQAVSKGPEYDSSICAAELQISIPAEKIGTKTDDADVKKLKGYRTIYLVLKRALSLFIHPLFLLVTTVHLFYSFGTVMYCIVLFDHALSINIARSTAVFLTTAFATAELIGKVCGGWITDTGLLKRRTLVIFAEIGGALVLLCHAFLTQEAPLFVAATILGCFNGICLTMASVMYVELLGIENLALCLGLKNSIVGGLAFLRPKIIGFSWQTFGSYVPLMYMLFCISLIFGLCWFLQPLIKKPIPKWKITDTAQARAET